MTPTSLTSLSRTHPKLADEQDNLACRRLVFSAQGHCSNKATLTAVGDALADKSSSDALIAVIFNNAWQHHYQDELNQLIKNIELRQGAGTVLITDNVKRLLADAHINLVQNSNGTVRMENRIAVTSDPRRHASIVSTLDDILPPPLRELISAYDDEIEISEKNRKEIIAILEYGDAGTKSAVIAAASHQQQIRYLNTLIRHRPLNLSGVDLSNLDLTGIDLTHADVSFANLQNCCLENAMLSNTSFLSSILNQANLTGANLSDSCLRNARLIAANLYGANLRLANLRFACLLCANLEQVDFGAYINLDLTTFNFCNIKVTNEVTTKMTHQSLKKLHRLPPMSG